MKPRTVSASSLNNWFSCQALFAAANLEYVPEFGQKNAANVGTAVHYALEHFVEKVYITRSLEFADLKTLLALYHEGFLQTFGHTDTKSAEYRDGLALVKKWHKRTDLAGWEILSVEQKRQLPIANTGVLLTFIFDRIQRRVDEDGRIILKVVDYKTIQRRYSHDQLRTMLQMRLYALAAAMQAKIDGYTPDEIWVELDLLRHEPIGIEISREENVDTWALLLETVQHILSVDADKAARTLGPNCQYCPIAASCPQLQKHITNGGVLSMSIDEMVQTYYELTSQIKAQSKVAEQLETLIFGHADEIEAAKFSVDGHEVAVSAGSRRGLSDESRAAGIIGPELMKMFGKLNIGDVDKLLESEHITDFQKNELRKLIVKNPTKQSLKIEPISPLAK